MDIFILLIFFQLTSTSSSEHLNWQHSARPASIPPCLKPSWRLEYISRASKLFLLRSPFLFWNMAAQSALSRASQIKEPTWTFQDSKWKLGGLGVRYLHDFRCSSKGQCIGTMSALLKSERISAPSSRPFRATFLQEQPEFLGSHRRRKMLQDPQGSQLIERQQQRNQLCCPRCSSCPDQLL